MEIPNGYVFEGWYTTPTFEAGTKVIGDYYPTGDTNFYANVIPNPTVSSVLTDLADEIRVLSGTTEPLGLDEMAANVNTVNAQVAEIEGLIEELNAALDGKSVPGSGGGANVETSHVNVFNCQTVYYTGVENGVPIAKSSIGNTNTASHAIYACKNTLIICWNTLSDMFSTSVNGAEEIEHSEARAIVRIYDAESVYIRYEDGTGGGGSNA